MVFHNESIKNKSNQRTLHIVLRSRPDPTSSAHGLVPFIPLAIPNLIVISYVYGEIRLLTNPVSTPIASDDGLIPVGRCLAASTAGKEAADWRYALIEGID